MRELAQAYQKYLYSYGINDGLGSNVNAVPSPLGLKPQEKNALPVNPQRTVAEHDEPLPPVRVPDDLHR